MKQKKNLYDYLTIEEKQIIKVLETAIENAKSIVEVEEAKYCIGIIMSKIIDRAKN